MNRVFESHLREVVTCQLRLEDESRGRRDC